MAEQIPADPSKIPSLKEPVNEFEELLKKQFSPKSKTLPPEKSDFEKLLDKPFKPKSDAAPNELDELLKKQFPPKAKAPLPKPPRKLPKLPGLGKLARAAGAVSVALEVIDSATAEKRAAAKPGGMLAPKPKAEPAPEPSTDRGGRLPDGSYKRKREGDPDGRRLLRFRDVIAALLDENDDVLEKKDAEGIIDSLRPKLLFQGNPRELETLAPLFPGQPTRYVARRLSGTGYAGEPAAPPDKKASGPIPLP